MRIPNQLSIAGHTIKVKYNKKLFVNGEECWGVYNDESHTIHLKMGMDASRKAEIFLHECIHAIEHIHVLNMSEKAVKVLGIEILALLRNNHINLLERKRAIK